AVLGGVIPAIERGYFQRAIADSAARYQREIEERKRIIVGVNDYVDDKPIRVPILKMDPDGERRQLERLARVRRERDNEAVTAKLQALREAARSTQNLMPFILDAVKAYATLQEVMDVLREEFGVYQEPMVV
ncbi:MAG: methylmalonyl-CoA mutase, partial [Anaerolineae bacterium]|nr:methylmalonyl-CoA mutase [Anaerolineae bacterium]